jgi:hypothetical protein
LASNARKHGTSPSQSDGLNAVRSELNCPECGKTFARSASLGAHRRRAHGVAGRSIRAVRAHRAAARRKDGVASAGPGIGSRSGVGIETDGAGLVDRNGLLATLFPHGIPPRDDLMREISVWLDQAEHLARKSTEHRRAA